MSRTLIILVFYISLFTISCKTYQPVTLSAEELLSREEFNNGYKNFVYYVHQGDSQIRLETPNIEGNSINAEISSEPAKSEEELTKKEKKEIIHLHIHKDTPLDETQLKDSIVSIQTSQIAKVDTHAKKRGSALSLFLYVLLGILGLFILLILLLVGLVATSDGSGGGSSSGGSSCYVATMVYGHCDAPEVMVLRNFRDDVLQRSKLGRKFINWYYKNSPGFVARQKENDTLHTAIKVVLDRLVKLIEFTCYK